MRKSESKTLPGSRKPRASDDEMRPEYDFSKGVRGATARRFAGGANLVVLDPDLVRLFPDSASVNRALRALAEIALRPRSAGGSKERPAGSAARKTKARRRAD